jgi:PhnB protein
MTQHVKGIPDGASVVIPRLFCRDPDAEIEFCVTTFGAAEMVRRPDKDGKTAHALLTIGPAMVMIEAEWPEVANRAPSLDATSPVVLFVYVEDVDQTVDRAVGAGARLLRPASNQFWGDRIAWIMDPSGHVWTVATRIEETTEEERQRRLARLRADEQANRGASALHGDALHLVTGIEEQRSRSQEGARGKLLLEIGAVHAVERVVVAHVRAEDLHEHKVVHAEPRRLQSSRDSIEHSPSLGLGGQRRSLRAIDPGITRQVQRVADLHGTAIRGTR